MVGFKLELKDDYKAAVFIDRSENSRIQRSNYFSFLAEARFS